jgi:glycosyltransferase involved in cell wall biosynthesis
MSRSVSVTVCIPTRNRATLVTSAIDSVLAQTYEDFTVLVSDNASEDDTEETIRAFDDPRLQYIRHRSNIGPGENFNSCLEAAASEYVIVLCDDDMLHPEFLEATVHALRANDRAGFAYTTWRRRRNDGTVEDWVINQTRLAGMTTLSGNEFIDLAIRQTSLAHMSGVLMRSEAIPAGGFELQDGFAMDVGILLRMAVEWDVEFLPAPLLHVRQESDSLTGRLMGVGADGRVSRDIDAEAKRREVRLRFLEGPGRDLPNVAQLRRAVDRYFRCRVMWQSANALRRGGHVRAARRALADGRAVDPKVMWDPYAWRSGLAVLAGPTLTSLLGGSRR